ncbi:MAG TPA: hypothetical protein VK440_04325, partial [Burkholderiales bacterium]|nr:hypothetical protein [Burkholderiales bacterium]
CAAIKLQRHNEHFVCNVATRQTTEELQARVVILAHGSWERGMLPTQAVHRPAYQSDLFAFKAYFQGSDLPQGMMPMLVFPGGYGGMVQTDNDRVSLSCCIRRDHLRGLRCRFPNLKAGDAVLKHIEDHCRGAREALARAQLENTWLAAGPIRPGIRKRYLGGIFLVGNAAGEAHPIVAEGISMAMQSAWMLSELLIKCEPQELRGMALNTAGSQYSSAWDAAFTPRIRAAALFAHLAMRPASAAMLLPLLKLFPGILTCGAKLSGKEKQVVNLPHLQISETAADSPLMQVANEL